VSLAEPALQDEVVRRGWDGALLPDPDLATLVLTIANITGNKSSPMVAVEAFLDVTPSPVDGMRRVSWTIEMNHLGDPKGNLEFNGFHRAWWQAYLPEHAELVSTSLDPEDPEMVDDPRALAWHIELLTAEQRLLTIEFDLPDSEDQLLLRRQS